jgi:hypothetical protein
MGINEKQIQTHRTDNLLNNIIAENSLNLEKERDIQLQEVYRTPTVEPEKKHSQIYHNQNSQYTEQRKNTESCKREKTCHI